MVGEFTDMYCDDMGHQSAKPDIGEVGVFCRVCHMWSDGQSDLCHYCLERLVGSRPLSKDSVAVWVGGQVDEHRALGIPVPAEDQDLLHRWGAFDSTERATISEAPDPERVRLLMKEYDIDWRQAWKLSQKDFDDDDVAVARRNSLRPWRIAVAVSGGLFLTMFGLLDWLWRTTEGDVSARNALGALAVLFALPMLGSFVAVVGSLIGLGINTKVRLERIASWSGAALLFIWFGWTLT